MGCSRGRCVALPSVLHVTAQPCLRPRDPRRPVILRPRSCGQRRRPATGSHPWRAHTTAWPSSRPSPASPTRPGRPRRRGRSPAAICTAASSGVDPPRRPHVSGAEPSCVPAADLAAGPLAPMAQRSQPRAQGQGMRPFQQEHDAPAWACDPRASGGTLRTLRLHAKHGGACGDHPACGPSLTVGVSCWHAPQTPYGRLTRL